MGTRTTSRTTALEVYLFAAWSRSTNVTSMSSTDPSGAFNSAQEKIFLIDLFRFITDLFSSTECFSSVRNVCNYTEAVDLSPVIKLFAVHILNHGVDD